MKKKLLKTKTLNYFHKSRRQTKLRVWINSPYKWLLGFPIAITFDPRMDSKSFFFLNNKKKKTMYLIFRDFFDEYIEINSLISDVSIFTWTLPSQDAQTRRLSIKRSEKTDFLWLLYVHWHVCWFFLFFLNIYIQITSSVCFDYLTYFQLNYHRGFATTIT